MRDDKNRALAGAAMQSSLNAKRNADNYTDYNYNVQIRIDSDTGELTVFISSAAGEIGSPVYGGSDLDIAHSVGHTLIEEARRAEHAWEPGETLEDHQQ